MSLRIIPLGGLGEVGKNMTVYEHAGEHDAARTLDRELAPSIEILRAAPNPIAIKAALNLLGHEVGGHRLPLVDASEDEIARVRGCLERLGLLVAV